MMRTIICGTGGYLPEKVLTNDDLSRMVDTSDAWIMERTGIRERRIAAPNELTSDMAVHAAEQALQNANLTASDIDLVIVATTTPDLTLPATAVRVQEKLGMTRGFAFDIQAVCSGFLYALSVADNYIKTGAVRNVLVIGAEKLSSIVDWTDRSTCILFGDGAGAVVLTGQPGTGDKSDRGLLNLKLRSEGKGIPFLCANGGTASTGTAGHITMAGREVFRYAVNYLAEIGHQTMDEIGVRNEEIDWLVPHQANVRIIEATAHKLNLPMEKVILTIQKHGNTSAASLPLALDAGMRSGKIRRGQLVLMEVMGGGFTWGGAVIRI